MTATNYSGNSFIIETRTPMPASPTLTALKRDEVPAGELLLAMRAFDLNPGHTDLDDEQPEIVVLKGGYVRVTLGEIRNAKRSFERTAFCSLQHAAQDIAYSASLCYWLHGAQHDYHARSLVEVFDQLAPLIEAVRATYCPSQEAAQ